MQMKGRFFYVGELERVYFRWGYGLCLSFMKQFAVSRELIRRYRWAMDLNWNWINDKSFCLTCLGYSLRFSAFEFMRFLLDYSNRWTISLWFEGSEEYLWVMRNISPIYNFVFKTIICLALIVPYAEIFMDDENLVSRFVSFALPG